MEFRGTKGRWELEYVAGEEFMRSSVNNGSIDVWADVNDVSIEEANANALLISKSPEMLVMLEDVYSDLKQGALPSLEEIENIKKLIKEATTL